MCGADGGKRGGGYKVRQGKGAWVDELPDGALSCCPCLGFEMLGKLLKALSRITFLF